MSDLGDVRGFEDARPPPLRPVFRSERAARLPPQAWSGQASPARLARLVSHAPEAVVVIKGRPRDVTALNAHLRYIARGGGLELEDQDGFRLGGKDALRELAHDWGAAARANDPAHPYAALACSMVFSAPRGSKPSAVAAASRALARETFADRFDYVSALHTDTPHPHLHVTVRALGHDGRRLNPSVRDGMAWRAAFARTLCEHGIEAVASLCCERGVTPRWEPIGLRKLRERHAQGRGEAADVDRAAVQAAARLAFLGQADATASEQRMRERQGEVRATYLAEAELLSASPDAGDRALAAKLEAFVAAMPEPLSRRQRLARELSAINKALAREGQERAQPRRHKERSR
jgi:hypothetical protein